MERTDGEGLRKVEAGIIDGGEGDVLVFMDEVVVPATGGCWGFKW